MNKFDEIFGGDDTFDPTVTYDLHKKVQVQLSDARKHRNLRDKMNDTGSPPVIPPEILEERVRYRLDYVSMHAQVFPSSTGEKPFGSGQIESIQRFQYVVHNEGKLVDVEPRGFGKTTRAVNQLLMAVLEGDIRFGLIVSSAMDKSIDIIEQIQSELMENEELFRLYPGPIGCFRHCEGKSMKAKMQTMAGQPTYIGWSKLQLRFPFVLGEPSSGAIILVRTKENLRGISKKINFGPENGMVRRPDFILLDDIQTDEDADSPAVCQKIIKKLKRSVMFGGSHTKKKMRAVLAVTPIREGDVATHYILNEPGWEVITYPMLRTMPDRMDLWVTGYARILLNYDRFKQGEKQKAFINAKQYVLDNYDEMHRGATASWEHAYNIETEVSAVQHAMTFLIEEGEEAFNYECQCKVVQKTLDEKQAKATIDIILQRTSNTPRRIVPLECKHIVTHVDMNLDVLSYVTMASNVTFQPFIIDYGTFPPQPGSTWQKDRIPAGHRLCDFYPTIPREDHGSMMYQAAKDFSGILGRTEYKREDGIVLFNRILGFDCRWQTDNIIRGIRESDMKQISMGVQGIGYKAKDKPMMEMTRSDEIDMHYHCYTCPSTDRVMHVLRTDVNYLKTIVHKGFLTNPGMLGSYRLFQSEYPGQHMLYAEQLCNSEDPSEDYNFKPDRQVTVWEYRGGTTDNEYFDNTVGATALLFKLGCTLKQSATFKPINMQEYMEKQKEARQTGRNRGRNIE